MSIPLSRLRNYMNAASSNNTTSTSGTTTCSSSATSTCTTPCCPTSCTNVSNPPIFIYGSSYSAIITARRLLLNKVENDIYLAVNGQNRIFQRESSDYNFESLIANSLPQYLEDPVRVKIVSNAREVPSAVDTELLNNLCCDYRGSVFKNTQNENIKWIFSPNGISGDAIFSRLMYGPFRSKGVTIGNGNRYTNFIESNTRQSDITPDSIEYALNQKLQAAFNLGATKQLVTAGRELAVLYRRFEQILPNTEDNANIQNIRNIYQNQAKDILNNSKLKFYQNVESPIFEMGSCAGLYNITASAGLPAEGIQNAIVLWNETTPYSFIKNYTTAMQNIDTAPRQFQIPTLYRIRLIIDCNNGSAGINIPCDKKVPTNIAGFPLFDTDNGQITSNQNVPRFYVLIFTSLVDWFPENSNTPEYAPCGKAYLFIYIVDVDLARTISYNINEKQILLELATDLEENNSFLTVSTIAAIIYEIFTGTELDLNTLGRFSDVYADLTGAPINQITSLPKYASNSLTAVLYALETLYPTTSGLFNQATSVLTGIRDRCTNGVF